MSASSHAEEKRLQPLSMGLIALYALFVGLSGLFALPPLDRDESRFIQATTQMLETGDYLRIRYQDTERNKKPAGIYWLQAASVSAFSDVEKREIWAYRLPSLISAILAALLVYVAGTILFSHKVGFWAALLMASAPVFAGESSIAKTDATLFFTVMLAQTCLAALFMRHRDNPDLKSPWWLAMMFWFAMGFGILIKGPITPMIALFTVAGLALTGQVHWIKFARSLKPLSGFLLILLMVVPWALAIYNVTDGRFLQDSVGTDMLGKVTEQQERHGGPPGYHLIALWFFFWPAALFIPRAIGHAISNRGTAAIIFLLSWLIPAWAVFELTSTKLPHYTLPLYPALALMVGYLIARNGETRPSLIAKIPGVVLYLLPGAAIAGVMVQLPMEYRDGGAAIWHYAFAVVTFAAALLAVFLFWRNRLRPALMVTILTAFMGLWFLFDGVLAGLDAFKLSPRIAQTLEEKNLLPMHDGTEPVALVGYHEPSAVFLLGTDTLLAQPQEAADYLTQGSGRVAIVEGRYREEFLADLPEGVASEIAEISGFNYSNNKDMVLTFYQSQATTE